VIRQMIEQQLYFRSVDGLQTEIMQIEQEGKDISGLREEVKEILEMDVHSGKQLAVNAFYEKTSGIPIKEGYSFSEPSDLPAIQKERPDLNISHKQCILKDEEIYNKIYGAWLGRCSGCLLGKPVEMWKRDRINGLAKATHNYPLQYYISSDIPENIKKEFEVSDVAPFAYGDSYVAAWINNVEYMPEDDDTNYTVLGLKLLEQYGPLFTNEDVAEAWLKNLPALHLFTAERVAYRNILSGILPPESGKFQNAYREWIGAQIRADIFGYVALGKIELAAEMAWRDASISHDKNGIYGEMFVAAMLAAVGVTDNITKIINAGLSQIPKKSRLADKIKEVIRWNSEGIIWETALDRIHQNYNENNFHDWCHVIPNAMIVCISLLFGEKDFEKSISIAVHAGFDTDCNGATVGSIMGMILGAKALPEKWIKPLNDHVESGIAGFGYVRISDLAKRTTNFLKNMSEA
jgi:ADP-ribosylglycohydrolase